MASGSARPGGVVKGAVWEVRKERRGGRSTRSRLDEAAAAAVARRDDEGVVLVDPEEVLVVGERQDFVDLRGRDVEAEDQAVGRLEHELALRVDEDLARVRDLEEGELALVTAADARGTVRQEGDNGSIVGGRPLEPEGTRDDGALAAETGLGVELHHGNRPFRDAIVAADVERVRAHVLVHTHVGDIDAGQGVERHDDTIDHREDLELAGATDEDVAHGRRGAITVGGAEEVSGRNGGLHADLNVGVDEDVPESDDDPDVDAVRAIRERDGLGLGRAESRGSVVGQGEGETIRKTLVHGVTFSDSEL